MFRVYARFSVNYPIVHKLNILLVAAIFLLSCYQLLANENLLFGISLLLITIPTFIFAKSSDYKRKYLSTNN
ncbi:hypothetical protein C9I98_11320 [Photobacterium sanctipauli]|uniref:Uncharacterized protein n=1 Tax=Photobacterium sanctipauli TaxID=1342794 RepID=A0A2T3NTC2_9GAMM|nr:hypothetical protein C9I98_11320 [Photobacterium sanctipauli]